jgi:hypothetical protein
MKTDTKSRLEYLRGELRAERISYGELHELQTMADQIEPGDVELLEAAGVPEFPEETKHTPGPWFTLDTGLDVFSEYPAEPGYLPRRRHISAAITTCQFDQEARANAALMAAAPELLEALEHCAGVIYAIRTGNVPQDLIPHIDSERIARAAIAKAKGETP